MVARDLQHFAVEEKQVMRAAPSMHDTNQVVRRQHAEDGIFVRAALSEAKELESFIPRHARSIRRAMDELGTGPQCDASAVDQLMCYLTECITKYGDGRQYSTDPRLLKIWILYADVTEAFPEVYKQLEEKRMFLEHALLYESYALYLYAKGKVQEADKVYVTGISRKAEPLDNLKKTHLTFVKHLGHLVEEADMDAQREFPQCHRFSEAATKEKVKAKKTKGAVTAKKNQQANMPQPSPQSPTMCTRSKTPESPAMSTRKEKNSELMA